MAILFPVKREMVILFFVKRDLDPPFTTLEKGDKAWWSRCSYENRADYFNRALRLLYFPLSC